MAVFTTFLRLMEHINNRTSLSSFQCQILHFIIQTLSLTFETVTTVQYYQRYFEQWEFC